MKNIRTIKTGFWILTALVLSGCSNKLWDPGQIGRFRETPAVNVILDSLGVAEESASTWKGAEEPRPIDVMRVETDYVFSPGDIVRISIFELLQEGAMYTNDYYVTETGKISIPEVGVIDVSGLTESQLEDRISDILSPSLLKKPSLSTVLINSEKRMYSINGRAVGLPGRYPIPRNDFRLNDALAIGRAETQFNVSYIYVSRIVTGKESAGGPGVNGTYSPSEEKKYDIPEQEMLEIIAPRAQRELPGNKLMVSTAEMVTAKELGETAAPQGLGSAFEELRNSVEAGSVEQGQSVEIRWEYQDGKWVQVSDKKPGKTGGPASSVQKELLVSQKETIDEPIMEQSGRIEWIFNEEQNRWIPVEKGGPGPSSEGLEPKISQPRGLSEKAPEGYSWDQIGTGGVQTRVIKIPTDKLLGGDPRYNIFIRSGDTIIVPVDVIGEFSIMGNVNNSGVITLTGRPMTLKMAIAAAGGLGPLAIPKRCEVIRRIGKNWEEIVMVDLDKIASGEQPDFFIKPNDLINVGTDGTARWRAVLRNAFRATYGFGFIYDRNFAERDFGNNPLPDVF